MRGQAEKADFSIFQREWLAAIANNVKHAGRLEYLHPLATINVYEQVAWEEGQFGLYPLSVLPHSNRFVCGKERLNISQIQMPGYRFLVLRYGEDRIPPSLASRIAQSMTKLIHTGVVERIGM
jgi:hypothetical protein